MRKCNPQGATDVPGEGRGQACTVIINQPSTDPGGWTIDLYAHYGDDQRPCWVQRVTLLAVLAAAGRVSSRVVLTMALPQAVTYAAVVTPPVVPGLAPIEVGVKVSDLTPAIFVVEPSR